MAVARRAACRRGVVVRSGRRGPAARRCAPSAEVAAEAAAPQDAEAERLADERRKGWWAELRALRDSGDVFESKVMYANKGGLVLRMFGEGKETLKGFCPLSQLTQAVLPPPSDGEAELPAVTRLKSMAGKTIRVCVIDVQEERNLIVLSERAASMKDHLGDIAVDEVVRGTVQKFADFGAFVSLCKEDGSPLLLDGLVHNSELAWSSVSHPSDVCDIGDELLLKVLEVDADAQRISLSLRELEADPLLETLDTVMPLEEEAQEEATGSLTESDALPGLAELSAELLATDGVTGVTPGRKAIEQRVVSQDLELWLTKTAAEDGYNVVARAGRLVQELHVATTLDREDFKAVVKRVGALLR